MLVGERRRYGAVANVSLVALPIVGIVLMFGAMSDSFWMSLFGFLATAFGLWLTYKKAADAQLDAAKAKTNSEKAIVVGDNTTVAIESVSEANKVQHKLMNSQLEEMKKIIYAAAKAEGMVQGRSDVKAEQDAEAAAMAKGVREAMLTTPPSSLPAVSNQTGAATGQVPVQVVPADDPLPVEVKVVLPKGVGS